VDPLLPNRFWVARTVTPVKFVSDVKTGRVALEGKPVCNGIAGFTCPTAVAPFANVPVQSAVASFAFAESGAAIIPDPRRQVVDIRKCQQCHDGQQHGATVVPRLSLHGNNRTENLGLCVVCHNPNQTDVPYRYPATGTPTAVQIAGPEVPIDFKVLVHSIHAGGFRTNPYVIVGFQSSVNDFSYVRFPTELRDCTNCHIDANGKGTFELPLKPGVLGTTVKTQSVFQVALPTPTQPGDRAIDVNPANDLRITPTAAVCSSCHDKAEVKSHMVRTGGASFATTQSAIGKTVNERCANCHGPGKDEDIRKAHEIGSGSSPRGQSRDD
jgi:OmcA/MtrC family decaheme c-type cytochrome